MLDRRTLARINDRPRGRGSAAYATVGTAAAAAAAFLVSYWAVVVVLLAGAAVVLLLHKRDVEARTTRLTYDLDGEMEASFSAVREACKALSGAEKVWRVEEEAWKETPPNEVLSSGGSASRRPVEVGLLETPGISANVEIWGIKTDVASLFFLPECVLSYKEDSYRAISYDSMGVVYRPARTTEDGEAPGDAEIIGETWRFVKADGSPDLRYPKNQRYAVVVYGLLSVTGTEPDIRLLVSNKAAAVRFARAFGGGRSEERLQEGGSATTAREERDRRHAQAEAEGMGPLLEILGVEPGASRKEIEAAYKKKAKMYHPDRVASLAPEVREMAELRMKEINAAYGELKRRTR